MAKGSNNAAKQVKEQVSLMPDGIFNVVAKYPQIKHVARNMCKPTMHKHRGD
jgi:hypothetical protein